MKIRPINIICFAIVLVLSFACESNGGVNSPLNTVSPLTGTVWTGIMVWSEGEQTEEVYINLGLYPMVEQCKVRVYTISKGELIDEEQRGIDPKRYEVTFEANGYFSCTVYRKSESGGIGKIIFQEDEGFCFYSGNALHLISKYNYKQRWDSFKYRVNGIWSITTSSSTNLVLKHQDTISRMTLVPLQ